MDEKGYVMSGLGFLLLIPVIIIIPIAISLEDQSSNLPETFVKSDTVFHCYKDIQADITDKVNEFRLNSYGKTYKDPDALAGNISYLYSRTNVFDYQNSFSNTVDSLQITPACSDTLHTNDTSGTIPLKNGIKIDYIYTGDSSQDGNYNMYNYTMNVTVNMTMNIKKGNTGFNKNFVAIYSNIPFQIDTTSAYPSNSAFFNKLGNSLGAICLRGMENG